MISDFGGRTVVPQNGVVPTDVDTGPTGMYGAIVVAPKNATFSNPVTGLATSTGAQVDVHVPGAAAYRDFTLLMQENDDAIGQSHMPYPTDVKGVTTVNYRSGKRTSNDVDPAYSSAGGDPATPILKAYVGDPVEVHAIVAPGSEQLHTFSLGGESWPIDPFIPMAEQIQTRWLGPWEGIQANITGGAGGGGFVGDMFYGDLRRPFTAGGMWGLQRVMSNATCPIKPLDGLSCTGGAAPPPVVLTKPALAPASDTGSSAVDNITKDSMPTFTGTAAPSSTVHLYVSGVQVATGTGGSRRQLVDRLDVADRRSEVGHVHAEHERRG